MDERGHHIPMFEHFNYNAEKVAEGLRDGWLTGEPPFYDVPVMPQWTDVERTHYQMYETVSEGTPISPVKESPEALALWLTDNHASAGPFSNNATYEQWLRVCNGGYAPSMIISNSVIKSGVEGL